MKESPIGFILRGALFAAGGWLFFKFIESADDDSDEDLDEEDDE